MFDVIVIGGGVIGGTILRELTKYKLNVCLLEKAADQRGLRRRSRHTTRV